ncbi:MAG: helix-turn-helix domain-containing protein [Lachnospiraceae bacterium]|nr:helix-turn-helix domain-containing protein [Lachnospiraceae bacterium]
MISQLYWEMGERIRSKRLELSLTQEQLSEKIGVSNKHLSEVERGNDRLSYDRLLLLCDVLDCSTDYLLRGRSTIADGIEIPESVLEIFRCSDRQEIEMLHEYLLLYSKILKYAPASDSIGKDSNKTQK